MKQLQLLKTIFITSPVQNLKELFSHRFYLAYRLFYMTWHVFITACNVLSINAVQNINPACMDIVLMSHRRSVNEEIVQSALYYTHTDCKSAVSCLDYIGVGCFYQRAYRLSFFAVLVIESRLTPPSLPPPSSTLSSWWGELRRMENGVGGGKIMLWQWRACNACLPSDFLSTCLPPALAGRNLSDERPKTSVISQQHQHQQHQFARATLLRVLRSSGQMTIIVSALP